ncbi:MAG: ATP-binding cassette, subfamily bacterial [Gaiellaceae bacterium]|nr:ATP-binding cassette, subfamily bacterial [Gaiellaceae bacterium]
MSAVPYRRTFVRLLGFLRPYKGSLLVSTILAVLSQAAAIAIVVLVGQAIDGIEAQRGTATLAWVVLAILVVGFLKAAFMVGRRLISGKQALGIEKDMREGLYAHLLRLSFGFYDRHQTGQLMSRATVDLQSVRFFLGFGLIFFFQHVLTVVSVMAVLFFVEWRLALIALAITPVIVAVAYRYSHVSHPVLREVQQKLGDVATVTEESIVGVHVVKAFAQEDRRQSRFERASGAVFDETVRAFRQRALYVPLLSFLPLLAQGAVLLVAGRMVVSGSLSLSGFFIFNLLLAMLIVPLRSLGMWIGQAQRATASGERIFEVMDEPEGVDDRPAAIELPAGPGAIRFESVGFGYAEGRPVLHEIELEIASGRTVALIGHTGSGKTTLAALVPRFYDATEGRVLVDGVDVRDVTRRSLRREIGVISQDPFLFSATVRENIAFGVLDATEEQVVRAAQTAQAHEFVEELPQGYDTVIGERGITLSGGQRQRLAIARALVIDPRILILDDATASVDATTESKIRTGLTEAMRGRTTIIIAHRLSTIALADEVVVLDHGRIAAHGTQAELLATNAVYKEIHEHGLLQGLLKESA